MSFVTIGNVCCGQFRLDGPYCPRCGRKFDVAPVGVTVGPPTREMLHEPEPVKPPHARKPKVVVVKVTVSVDDGDELTVYGPTQTDPNFG